MSATPFEKPQGAVEVPHIEVDEETKEIIREILSQMKNTVEVLFFTSNTCGNRDTNWCVPTEELLDLLAELAPPGKLVVRKIRYEEDSNAFVKYNVEPNRVPVIYLLDGAIRYLGAPLGEEVRAFIETIVRISVGETKLRPRTKKGLEALANSGGKRVEVMTVVTPSCPYCPYAVLMANMFAYDSKGRVISTTVEAYEESDIADMYQVSAVPTIVLRREDQDVGNVEFIGVPPESDLLKKVLEYSGVSLQ
ncbi:MAG: thioredoxin family protein [Vulcanisaeta sp.]|jgi:glutaredoxin-like protein|nr:thioredoxin family protein [Vulcanisaeta sp.]MCG2880409.1 thioredoxin family protein [Vulcanisaeta sp.]MCG2887049.1 thioredoxin family protein [Vulcanisaeta sp.]MCG2895002.1 thioredoxin family protein [Vulcanisaeta sp.]